MNLALFEILDSETHFLLAELLENNLCENPLERRKSAAGAPLEERLTRATEGEE